MAPDPVMPLFESCARSVEGVDADSLAEACSFSGLRILERRAGGIGHSIDRVEKPGDPSGIDESGRAHRLEDGPPRPNQSDVVAAEDRIGEFDKAFALGNAAVTSGRNQGQRPEIVALTAMLAARTEQLHMAGGSIGTLVDGRNPAGQQLDLRVADCAIFP